MVELQDTEYLKADDVGDKATVVFVDDGEYKQMLDKKSNEMQDVLNITVDIKGKRKVWTPNFTSRTSIKKLYGSNTSAWIGKKVNLITTTQMVGKEKKKIIYVED